jgi:hypothetical protein
VRLPGFSAHASLVAGGGPVTHGHRTDPHLRSVVLAQALHRHPPLKLETYHPESPYLCDNIPDCASLILHDYCGQFGQGTACTDRGCHCV